MKLTVVFALLPAIVLANPFHITITSDHVSFQGGTCYDGRLYCGSRLVDHDGKPISFSMIPLAAMMVV